jgi:SAM-dependent methyltransferase
MFDLAREYDAQLHQGLRLSGEDKDFFIRGRLSDLRRRLPAGFRPERILDFGCGVGDTARHLAAMFPEARVVGFDTSEPALALARRNCASERVSFCASFPNLETVDLCYCNGVFHHIPRRQRPEVMGEISRKTRAGGLFALFENNPWNPGTRMVMRRIPFDREAQPLPARETRRLLEQGGFSHCYSTRYLFYFPRPLARLRPLEPLLVRLPLGAQYYLMARK